MTAQGYYNLDSHDVFSIRHTLSSLFLDKYTVLMFPFGFHSGIWESLELIWLLTLLIAFLLRWESWFFFHKKTIRSQTLVSGFHLSPNQAIFFCYLSMKLISKVFCGLVLFLYIASITQNSSKDNSAFICIFVPFFLMILSWSLGHVIYSLSRPKKKDLYSEKHPNSHSFSGSEGSVFSIFPLLTNHGWLWPCCSNSLHSPRLKHTFLSGALSSVMLTCVFLLISFLLTWRGHSIANLLANLIRKLLLCWC